MKPTDSLTDCCFCCCCFYYKNISDSISAVLRMRPFDSSLGDCFSECHVSLLMCVWAAAAVLTWVLQNVMSGQMKRWMSYGASGNNYLPLNSRRSQSEPKSSGPRQRTFSYPDALEFNFFDPDNLPEMIKPYASVVFTTVQSLAKQYGFQVDNSRNQAEHLLMLLTNELSHSDTNSAQAATRLHMKMFVNYRNWCVRMVVPPLFSRKVTGIAATVEDILVFLLVWGEAANLKHLPECLCFLYHKTMQEHMLNTSRGVSPSTYPGYYLDMVVTPMYEVVAASLRRNEDNEHKKTYDDFNEFFWSPSCMRYQIHDGSGDAETGTFISGNEDHVSVGMQNATKTYLEKRSWLHPLLSVHRVIEWHIITFTLLMAWAFANELMWTFAFTFQVASFIFWEITFLGLIWTCLEVRTYLRTQADIISFLSCLVPLYLHLFIYTYTYIHLFIHSLHLLLLFHNIYSIYFFVFFCTPKVWTIFPNTSIPGPSIYGFLIRSAMATSISY